MPSVPSRRSPGSVVSGWPGKVFLALGIVALSVVAGAQVVNPDPRVLQVVAAVAVVFLAFRATSISALAFAVLLLPFPKGTSYGNTNVAFTLLILLVWIFRVSTKREVPAVRTALDVPLLCLVMAYAISFYEVDAGHFTQALSLFLNLLSYLLVLYLMVNIIKTSKDVQKVLAMQYLSCIIVCLFAVYEQGHPGASIIPGWIDLGASEGMTSSIRVGSTFLDYELFGEYCVLNLFLQMFLFTRATSNTRRWLLTGTMLLTFYCLFATVTRGALISFLAGSAYLLWLSRERLNFVKLVMILSLSIGMIAGADFVVANFTNSDSVLERLFGTKIENGIPDTRAGAWKMAAENIAAKPIIGHGPYYADRRGVEVQWWPHNVYLFYGYIVGLVGLAFFLWFLWELWRITRPRALSLGSGTYLQGGSLLARVLLFTFMIDQTKIDYLRNPRYSFFVWMLFGLLYAMGRAARDEAAQPALAPVALDATPPRPAVARAGVALRPAIQRVSAAPAVPNR